MAIRRKLNEGLKMSLSYGSGLLFYLTLIVGYVLALMILAKQFFDAVTFSLPHYAVEMYFAFLAAFVFTNELDKWRMGGEELRLFRKGENALIVWLVALLVSWSLEFFMNKPVPEALGFIITGVLIVFMVSKISTGVKYHRCNGDKNGHPNSKK